MAVGVKEISELLDGVQVLGVAEQKVMADGKVGVSDIPVLLGLLKDFHTLAEAFKGIDQIPAEAKDLDSAEAEALINKILAVVAAIKAA